MKLDAIKMTLFFTLVTTNSLSFAEPLNFNKYGPLFNNSFIGNQLSGFKVSARSGGDFNPQQWSAGIPQPYSDFHKLQLNSVSLSAQHHSLSSNYNHWGVIIPEFVESIEWIENGSSANFVKKAQINYVDDIPAGFAKLAAGDLGQTRVIGGAAFDVLNGKLIYGVDYSFYDGPWDYAEDFQRFNGFLRYIKNKTEIAMYSYNANWFSAPNIPQRIIDDNRFVSLSETDEQVSKKITLTARTEFETDIGILALGVDWADASVEKFHNKTFFLQDPVNGDQRVALDDRGSLQLTAEYSSHNFNFINANHQTHINLTHSTEDIENQFGEAQDGITIGNNELRNHDLTQSALEVRNHSNWTPDIGSVMGLSIVRNTSKYIWETDTYNPEQTQLNYSIEASKTIGNSMITASYRHNVITSHAAVQRVSTDDDQNSTEIDNINLIYQHRWPERAINASVDIWHKWFDDALVYQVGTDQINAIPNISTTGLTGRLTFSPNKLSNIIIDSTWQTGRSDQNSSDLTYLPRLFANARLALSLPNASHIYLDLNHLGSYHTNSATSTRVGSSTTFNASATIPLSKKVTLGLEGFNIFSTQSDSYAEYYTSQLENESMGTTENHIVPVAPASFRATLWLEW